MARLAVRYNLIILNETSESETLPVLWLLLVFVFYHYFLPFPRRSPGQNTRRLVPYFSHCSVPVPVMVARREPDRAITRAAAANKPHIIAAACSNADNNIVQEIRPAGDVFISRPV